MKYTPEALFFITLLGSVLAPAYSTNILLTGIVAFLYLREIRLS